MNILFVCSGNTCRSPMAEGYLKSLNLKDVKVSSAGLQVGPFGAVSENSVTAMKEIGIDISSHTPRPITREIIENSDKIICMTATHKAILELSGIKADISVLGSGIFDPYGSDEDMYSVCRQQITDEIDRLINGVVIRPYKESDCKAIEEIEKECFSIPWSEKAITEAVDNGTVFLVAEKCFGVIGYVSVNTALDEGYINNIAVKSDFRRQGIAERLLKALDKKAEELNLAFLSLEVRASNKNAISLYEKAEYKNMGVRKKFYSSPIEDAIIMTKTMRD